VCTSFSGSFIKKTKQDVDFLYPVYNGGISPTGYYDQYNTEANSVAISARGASRGFVNWVPVKFWAGNSCHVINSKSDSLLNRYLYHYLKFKELELNQMGKTGSIPALNLEPLLNFNILVPEIAIQKDLIKTLDILDTLINDISIALPAEIKARHQQYEHYRNRLLTFKELDAA
jgi:type I restriction enzyme S subunit